MKLFILTLFLACATAQAQESAAAKPNFPSLRAALIWMDLQLGSGDYKQLQSSLRSPQSPDAQLGVFRALHAAQRTAPLADLFKNRSFPEDKNQLKLGGHNRELGHIHIDFIRMDGHWYLDRIWMCR